MSTDRKKILLIDDDASLVVTLSDFLRFEGYDVVTAHSGEQGLEVLDLGETIDLIVLDMSMPGMGGMGFLEAIMGESGKPLFPVLVLTAKAHMAEDFADISVDGFVAKPCDPQDLLMEVSRIVFLRRGEDIGSEDTITKDRAKVLLGGSCEMCDALDSALAERKMLVHRVYKAADLLERAIVEHPDVIAVHVQLKGMALESVLAMLGDMSNTRSTPIVLCGEGDDKERVKSLSECGARIVASVCPASAETVAAAVVDAVSRR